MIQSIVPVSLYRQIDDVEKELRRQLERMPFRRVVDSGLAEDILRTMVDDPTNMERALALVKQSVDERGRRDYNRLTDSERSELLALLSQENE